jgi:GNAT superfamily N-acetyltransferase
MPAIRVTTNPLEVDLELAHRWMATTYWSENIPWPTFENACANSLVWAALDHDRQVGFARVVTDRATFAWLCDVFVAEDARGRGVARRLVEAVLSHSDLQGLRQFVLGTRDAHGLYEKFGFERIGDTAGRFMRIAHPARELYGR